MKQTKSILPKRRMTNLDKRFYNELLKLNSKLEMKMTDQDTFTLTQVSNDTAIILSSKKLRLSNQLLLDTWFSLKYIRGGQLIIKEDRMHQGYYTDEKYKYIVRLVKNDLMVDVTFRALLLFIITMMLAFLYIMTSGTFNLLGFSLFFIVMFTIYSILSK